MNLFEKILGAVAPGYAADRAKSRMLLNAYNEGAGLFNKRGFDAASRGRRGTGWNATGSEGDANLDIAKSLVVLRERSRSQFKNNPYARKAIKTIALNVVGTGIQPVPKATTKRNSDRAKKAWADWASTKSCDFYGRHNFYGLQMLAMRTIAMSGEVLVIRRRNADTEIPIQIQILEGDFLDHNKSTLTVNPSNPENYIVQGVEFDGQGRRVAYWIFEQPPTNMNAGRVSSKPIPAADVLHVYEELRPGQVRGIPFLVAAMLRFKDFDDYEDAQLIRQKVAACFTAFVTSAPSIDLPGSESSVISEMGMLEPGIIERLNPGEEVTFANPPGAEGYAEYTKKIQQGMAAGAGITYEAMTGDMSNVNFSSGRMGWIESQQQVEDWQFNTFIPGFCDGVWQWFSGALRAKGLITENVAADWTPRGRYMIDPAKEIQGITAAMGNGLISWSEAVREQGYDPDTLLEQIKADAAKLRELGIPFEWLFGKASAQRQDNNDPQNQNQ